MHSHSSSWIQGAGAFDSVPSTRCSRDRVPKLCSISCSILSIEQQVSQILLSQRCGNNSLATGQRSTSLLLVLRDTSPHGHRRVSGLSSQSSDGAIQSACRDQGQVCYNRFWPRRILKNAP